MSFYPFLAALWRRGFRALLFGGCFFLLGPVGAQKEKEKQTVSSSSKKKSKKKKAAHPKNKSKKAKSKKGKKPKKTSAEKKAKPSFPAGKIPVADGSFLTAQLQYPRVAQAHEKLKDVVLQSLLQKGLDPQKFELYLRSFKYDSELEAWGRNAPTDSFCLLKTFSVCALSGELGHKRSEGDYQVPEGLYHLTQFQPKSKFHLSIGINYPNAADRHWTDSLHPGGEIFIHGTCTTVGCIPIRNGAMEELYLLAVLAKNNGQTFIPIHIFPARFNKAANKPILEKAFLRDPLYKQLTQPLLQVYQYFQATHRLPVVGITAKGEYLVLGASAQDIAH